MGALDQQENGLPPLAGTYSNFFPHLVIRIFSAVYKRVLIDVREGPEQASVEIKGCFVQTPLPFNEDRSLSEDAKQVLIATVQDAVERMNLRMCIVWAKDNCTYVEPKGMLIQSIEPPSGGVDVPFSDNVA